MTSPFHKLTLLTVHREGRIWSSQTEIYTQVFLVMIHVISVTTLKYRTLELPQGKDYLQVTCLGLAGGGSVDWVVLAVNLAQLFSPEKSGKNATEMLDFSKLQDKWRTEDFSLKKEEPKHNLFGVWTDVNVIFNNIPNLYIVSVFKIRVSVFEKNHLY